MAEQFKSGSVDNVIDQIAKQTGTPDYPSGVTNPTDVVLSKIDYEKKYKNLISELVAEKEKKISELQYECQVQMSMNNIQLQNAVMESQVITLH